MAITMMTMTATTKPVFFEPPSLKAVSNSLPAAWADPPWMGKSPESAPEVFAILAATSGLAGPLTGVSAGVSWGWASAWGCAAPMIARNSSVSPPLPVGYTGRIGDEALPLGA